MKLLAAMEHASRYVEDMAEFHVAAHRLRLAVRADAQQRLLAGFVGQFRLDRKSVV